MSLNIKPSASADSAASHRTLDEAGIPDPTNNVFIPLDATAESIRKLVFESGQITFVRAPVAAGKTTLAHFLANTYPDKYVMVETGCTDDEWEENLKDAYPGARTAKEAVRAIQKQNKALIIDEAHSLFGCMEVYAKLTKYWLPADPVKMLLFSAAGTGRTGDGSLVATPAEIRKKYMWYPPIPNGNDLALQLQEAGILLDGDAVDFLMKICCGHRGIFMSAMRWVQERQEDLREKKAQQVPPEQTLWDLNTCVAEVRHSFEADRRQKIKSNTLGWSEGIKEHMMRSRAVRVNGDYSDLANIPKEFIDILFGGSKETGDLNNKQRDLTIAGFLVPERKQSDVELVRYDWARSDTKYGVANPLMAEYYIDEFSRKGYHAVLDDVRGPTSGSDLLSRALPYLTFTKVVDNVIMAKDGVMLKSPLTSTELPYEDHYNGALRKVFSDLGYTVSQPENSDGKVDAWVRFDAPDGTPDGSDTCAIETIMAYQALGPHEEHSNRFAKYDKPNYSGAYFKALLVIGDKKDIVRHRVEHTVHVPGVEIVGVVASQAHDSYEMFVRKATESATPPAEVEGPFFILCDWVAKSFTSSDSAPPFTSVQKKRKIDDV